ncbi:MAG: homocysteine S-methyltransferase family protein [Clostridia bacterium]|nr:homocysteine S-methyltransferase family protein [Clostridia bacterium]
MDILTYLKDNIVYLDGGTGTLLQSAGLKPGEFPETWNISHSDIIQKLHRDYFDAGANIVCTNTFGANCLKFSEKELEDIISSAIKNAHLGAEQSKGKQQKFVALDIGPSGRLLAPYGDFDFEDAVKTFAKTVRLGVKCGIDLILIETMNDSYETKAALLAAKENSNLPVFVSNAYGEDGKLMTGASPEAMCALLEGMGADAIGVNCSFGPAQLMPTVKKLLEVSSVPVILKPNAGLPKSVGGKTVYDVAPEEFAESVLKMLKEGVRVAGGCCGTTPQYIKALVNASKGITPAAITKKNLSVISSYTHTVDFKNRPILIGERINPTGKKRFRQALLENDIDYILKEGVNQQEKGVHILDVNVGLPDIDEKNMLKACVCELQSIIELPLQIDTSDTSALEAALRRYNGKAMINSVNGKKSSMDAVFPLVKKYGGLVVALTLDEDGIPQTAKGRLSVASKILKEAEKYGLGVSDLIFDPLAMAVSADKNAAKTTLESVRLISEELGANTVLGVSNISFGLPSRDSINSIFFANALENGLSAAIMNPYSEKMLETYYSYRVIAGLDDNCSGYIENLSKQPKPCESTFSEDTDTDLGASLTRAVLKGFKEDAAKITKKMLKTYEPLSIINNYVIPALDSVGKGFEEKTVYLPQLLMSAETAKSAFEEIKLAFSGTAQKEKKCAVVIATVKGDIHDIGKNIVKLLLENYGFSVSDLGKDVPCEKIADETVRLRAPIVGLSALMTTTVPQMEETIRILRKRAPWCKIIVGGAVLTQEYADSIGADKYAKDAMESVRYAESINEKI